MEKENLKILAMLECGKITVCEALYLLESLRVDLRPCPFLDSLDEPLKIEIRLS